MVQSIKVVRLVVVIIMEERVDASMCFTLVDLMLLGTMLSGKQYFLNSNLNSN